MDRPYVLGVDLDGVCGDYTGAFRTIVATELGIDEESLPLQRSWDFTEWGLSADESERLHDRWRGRESLSLPSSVGTMVRTAPVSPPPTPSRSRTGR